MRYIVHGFIQGLYASLAVAESGMTDRDGRAAIISRDGLVYDMTGQAHNRGVRLGMKINTAQRFASVSTMVPYDEKRLQSLLEPFWKAIWEHTPWLEIREREVFFALTCADPRTELRQMAQEWKRIFTVAGWGFWGGVGTNKLIAKMATRAAYRRKARGMPVLRLDGHTILYVVDENQWMQGARIQDLWRLPKTARERLNGLGIHTVKELQAVSPEDIRQNFGAESVFWLVYAHGEDHAPVRVNFPPLVREVRWRAKGEEISWRQACTVIQRMAEALSIRLRSEAAGAEKLTLRIAGVAEERAGTRNDRLEVEAELQKPVSSADQIWRHVEKRIASVAFISVNELALGVGALRPLTLRQLEWDVADDRLCDSQWTRRTDMERICEVLQDRFSARLIAFGCARPRREEKLAWLDPFRGGGFR